ncbi:hypothetical protein DSLASN_03310 [Desulfoluna limicola]|uniref:Tetratricopeptide repeat protein n=1 Tax=Desulfoluna limicola TaxID=2810562 RepID=A0ABM7PC14_9BACT|nr:tetratricopeptide repeat protein [Desulfoluna limicola]BCS94699.1 hypothetical protein DSLASN_03310 [Desulfoluna limicola]
MTDKENTSENPVQTRTSPILLTLTLVIGFLLGVAFSAWKLKDPDYASAPPQGTTKLAQMAEALEAQVAKDPKNANLLARLGNTYFDTNQYPKAIDAYMRSIAIDPSNTNVLTDLGIMYRRNNQPQEAIASFEAAIAVNPEHENAYLNKGIVLMYDLDNREEAIKTWETLRDINPLAMAGNQSIDELITHFQDGHDSEGKK